jgi:hypothetical protein
LEVSGLDFAGFLLFTFFGLGLLSVFFGYDRWNWLARLVLGDFSI